MKYILLFAILNLALCNQLFSQDSKEGFFMAVSSGYGYTGKDIVNFSLNQVQAYHLRPTAYHVRPPESSQNNRAFLDLFLPINSGDVLDKNDICTYSSNTNDTRESIELDHNYIELIPKPCTPLIPWDAYTKYSHNEKKIKLNLIEASVIPEFTLGYEWEDSGVSIDFNNERYKYELNDVFLSNNVFNVTDKINSSKLNFNYFYKFNYDLPFTTYLGAGVGVNFFVGHFIANNLTREEVSANDLVRKMKITANMFAGLGWAVTYNVELFASYKISDLAIRTYSNESNRSVGSQGINKDTFFTQKIAIGIKYYFG